jgi:uncharacterized membrane protein YbhN (UPF0104 family)
VNLRSLIKPAISFLMLYLIFRGIDLSKFTNIISNLSLRIFIIVCCTYSFGQVLSSYKWWRIAQASGIDVPFSRALRAYFFGMFCNCFGVGVVGGDVARGLLLGLGQPIKTKALASVIADRLHGLCILALIGSASVIFFGLHDMQPWLVLSLASLGPMTLIGWFVGPYLVRKFLPANNKFCIKIVEISSCFPQSPKVLIHVSLVSAFFHLLQIGVHRIIGTSIGVDLPWSYLLPVIPFVNICSTLPISWNGLGVRENAYKFFLAPAVLSYEQVIALGALWIAAMTTCSVIGGLASMIGNDPISEAIRKRALSSEPSKLEQK